MEQFVRMLHHVGLPMTDIDLIYCDGPVMNEVMVKGESRMCLFTGSQAIAEKLTLDLRGRVKLEDAGFDWKVLGPDVVHVGSKRDPRPRPMATRARAGAVAPSVVVRPP